MSRYVIAKHRPHNCGDDRCENHGKVFPSPNGPLVNVLDLPDAEHIHLHRRPDGTFGVVPMRLSAAAKEAWGAEMWVDASEQENDR